MLNFSRLLAELPGSLAPKLVGGAALAILLGTSTAAEGSVPLRRADIEQILNRVELIPRGRAARTARLSDYLAIGDALRTAAASRAELRFNDGSFARVGERATFHFIPNTRNFRLNDGTMLLLIPPGRGRTTIQTPSAVTGIQGSALVVRHVEARNLTMVMALTDNPTGKMAVTVTDCGNEAECTLEHGLSAGQMILIHGGKAEVLEFDLLEFYQTSDLVAGLELDNPDADFPLGGDLEKVRQETLDALENYRPIEQEQGIILNPAMVGVDSTEASIVGQTWLLRPQTDVAAEATSQPATLLPAGILPETIATDAPESESGVAVSPVRGGTSGNSNPNPAPSLPAVNSPGTAVEPPTLETPEPAPEPVIEVPVSSPEPVVDTPEPSPEPVVEVPVSSPEPVVSTPEPAPEPVVDGPVSPPEPVVEAPVSPPEPVVEAPVSPPEPVVEAPVSPPEPVVEAPEPTPEPVGDVASPIIDGPGQAEPPPFNGFPDKDEVPNSSLEDGPGEANPEPFSEGG